ncbi:helix-turn-helix transcriptional regulator [Sphaerobacter sp.]|uniref:helix-turn-helix domain-containing protein n=1 Tax=Sphaerobacter sp. TaxID=2099654 RepID=UPI001D9FAAD8|nr:helix-turn-helix transcriptional regulator [Sphaerobacter sp.]MBX5444140.1 helix-turn-helix transcriptional regulator [Sphaerobacter sp.]
MSDFKQMNDDLDAYIATLSDNERADIAAASEALDIAHLLYHARLHRGLTQKEAAARSGLKQQAISRLERAATNVTLATLQRYLGALGYTVVVSLRDKTTGRVVVEGSSSPVGMTHVVPTRRPPTRLLATR